VLFKIGFRPSLKESLLIIWAVLTSSGRCQNTDLQYTTPIHVQRYVSGALTSKLAHTQCRHLSELKYKIRCSRRRQTSPRVPPPGKLNETYASSLILSYCLHYMACPDCLQCFAAGNEVSDYSLNGKQQKQQSSKNRHHVGDWCKQKQACRQTRS